tara:strand:- start:8605 stop:9036 length:432 start_codon:yes stop_codon:yes gene_type:complete
MNAFVSKMSLVSVFFCLLGCNESKKELADFTSDGCSLFINGTFANPDLWEDCCTLHDMAYWRGGTEEERKQADLAFRSCVEKKTGNSELAEVMYQAVRTGGEPYFPTWYRWGYGWPVGRGYRAISPEEEKMVEQKLRKFRQGK